MSTGTVLYDAPGPKAQRRSRIIGVIGTIALVGLFAYVIYVLAQEGIFDADRWDIFEYTDIWVSLGQGLLATLGAAAVAAVLSFVLAVVIVLFRLSEHKWVRYPMTTVLEFLRGMPVVLMMLFALLVFGADAFFAVVIGLTLYNGAIMSEILRAGIQSLPPGQREAGLSIGLSPVRTRLIIELPQAIRRMLPSLVAQLVVLLKDTSLGYIVGYQELLRTVQLNSDFFGNKYLFSIFFVATAIYLVVNFSVSRLATQIEQRKSRRIETDLDDPLTVPGVQPMIRTRENVEDRDNKDLLDKRD